MTAQETQKIMNRIKEHYQDFIIDNGKLEEWHRFLKDYDYEDVSKKLDEHLSSEQYGQYIPKVAFLVKYLRTTKEKNETPLIYAKCNICGKVIEANEYEKHYHRCNSVRYLDMQYNKYFLGHLDKEKLLKMSDDEFKKLYDKMLNHIKDNTTDENEKERVIKILDNKEFVQTTSDIFNRF